MENHRGFINIINRSQFLASTKQGDIKTNEYLLLRHWISLPRSSLAFLVLGKRESFKELVVLDLCLEREIGMD